MNCSDGDAKCEHEEVLDEEQQRGKEEASCEEIEVVVELEEEDIEEVFDDEAVQCKKKIAEGLSWKEPSDREQIRSEEDPAGGFETRLSSSSEKKRRLADELLDHMQKRQKQNEDTVLGLCFDSISTDFKDSTSHAKHAEEEADGSSGKKKRSRLDRVEIDSDPAKKKRKTRWYDDGAQSKLLGPLQLPDFANTPVGDPSIDPRIEKLNCKLIAINKKLNAPATVDGQPSPSNDVGMNKTQDAIRQKLVKRRQKIISELIKRNPAFAPPLDKKLPKLYKKIYVPVKQYPGYNFIGLILGPRGNTQKRMEMETGAKIFLRGKGSIKQGYDNKWRNAKHEPSADDDLHVCIYADTQKSLDAAVELVEKLLIPVEEEINVHKQAQLRELAALNGTLRKASSNLLETSSVVSYPCDNCGSVVHPTAACPLTASNPETSKSEILLPDVGNTGGSSVICSVIPSSGSSSTVCPQCHVPELSNSMPMEETDKAELFVSCLPQSVDDNKLKELFSPFGFISHAAVIKDRTTGFSKGYGFVEYTNSASATAAVTCMNGYRIDGKILSVKIASQSLSASSKTCKLPEPTAEFNNLPAYPSRAAISEEQLGVMSWPGPLGFMLSGRHTTTFPEQGSFVSHSNFFTGPSPFPFRTRRQNLAITSCEESEQFPGYHNSIDCENQACRFPCFCVPLPMHVLPARACNMYRASLARLPPPWYVGHPRCFRNQGNTSL